MERHQLIQVSNSSLELKTQGFSCSKKYKSLEKAYKNGYNPQLNRGRNKRSYMEKSFEEWLLKEYPNIDFIMEKPFQKEKNYSL